MTSAQLASTASTSQVTSAPAARSGLGFVLNQASQQFDMTAIYAVLVILMIVGIIVSETAVRLETWLLRWRNTDG